MVADSVLSRMIGLLGRKSLEDGSGLWLKPCKGVHTFFMKFSIDVVFLDVNNRVVAINHDLQPNRMTKLFSEAATALELPSSSATVSNLSIGDIVDIAL